jgi:transposase-like protein
MTKTPEGIEIIEAAQPGRRRRFTAEEKRRLVAEAAAPGMSVSQAARRHGLSASLLFRWRRLMEQGELESLGADEQGVALAEGQAAARPSPRAGAAAGQADAGSGDAAGSAGADARKKTAVALELARTRRFQVKALAEASGVARSNLVKQLKPSTPRPRGSRPDDERLNELSVYFEFSETHVEMLRLNKVSFAKIRFQRRVSSAM